MRVVRLLVYEGEESQVMDTLDKSIAGKKILPGMSITAITLGTVPDDLRIFMDNESEKGEGDG